MKVNLAGFNLDKDIIEKLPQEITATPETISAAYARISRDPRDVPELREEARIQVKKARRSNQAIVFGMSHHSVAEHAYFNFDILKISRLALEELEARRIGAAYTEKSQRYITLEGDHVVPAEYKDEDIGKFKALVKLQNQFYLNNITKLTEFQFENNPDLAKQARLAAEKGVSDKMNRAKNTLEGWAKEDARYALSLASEAQLGLSFNARTLEHAIRKMRHSRLAEVKELSRKLYDATKDIAPSLIILTDPNEFKKAFKTDLQDDHFKFTRSTIRKKVAELIKTHENIELHSDIKIHASSYEKLVECNNIDLKIAAAILYTNSDLSLEIALALADSILKNSEGKDFFTTVLQHLSAFDPLPREFEMTSDLMFEAIVSASNYAQLKRHRLMTLLAQDYDPRLGVTVPESIKSIGAEDELQEVCNRSTELYQEFFPRYGKAAEYCLTNAHRRRVLIGVNPRELYHFSRLREDEHAQWDIKETAGRILELAKQAAPLTFMLSGGKDKFTKS